MQIKLGMFRKMFPKIRRLQLLLIFRLKWVGIPAIVMYNTTGFKLPTILPFCDLFPNIFTILFQYLRLPISILWLLKGKTVASCIYAILFLQHFITVRTYLLNTMCISHNASICCCGQHPHHLYNSALLEVVKSTNFRFVSILYRRCCVISLNIKFTFWMWIDYHE